MMLNLGREGLRRVGLAAMVLVLVMGCMCRGAAQTVDGRIVAMLMLSLPLLRR